MDTPLLSPQTQVALVNADNEDRHREAPVAATQDHHLIRRWASRRQAEPATGEATASGGRTLDVRDGDAGIRFNFPGAGYYRPISWDEWFENFEKHELIFVYERDAPGEALSARYRIVKSDSLKGLTI